MKSESLPGSNPNHVNPIYFYFGRYWHQILHTNTKLTYHHLRLPLSRTTKPIMCVRRVQVQLPLLHFDIDNKGVSLN